MTAVDRRTFLGLGAAVLVGCSSTRSGAASPGSSGPPQTLRPNSAITSLAMVGDSITEASTDPLSIGFGAVGLEDVRIEGAARRRIEVGNGKGDAPISGIRTVYSMLAEGLSPSVWVIALGTNDVGSYPDAAAYGGLIDQITAMLPPPTPLVWVNVYRPRFLDDTITFNTVLAERLDERGESLIVDWFSVASAPDQSVLRSDDIHPNENGTAAFAQLVVQALQRL